MPSLVVYYICIGNGLLGTVVYFAFPITVSVTINLYVMVYFVIVIDIDYMSTYTWRRTLNIYINLFSPVYTIIT